MSLRWRIIVFEIVTLIFVALMIGVMAIALRLADDFVQRVDGVHRRFEVIAELDGNANNYAEQIAEVLLLGAEQMPDFQQARAEMVQAFDRLREVTRAEVSTLAGLDEVRTELSDVEATSRMIELYRAIDMAAERVFALQREGKQAEAVESFRRDVEYRLSNDFENLLEAALDDERGEVARELGEVREQQRRLLAWSAAIGLLALLCGAALGYALHRSIVRPVQALAAGARAIAGGALAHRIPAKGSDEFAALSRSFNEMAASLETQRTGLIAAQQRLHSEVELRTRELRDANERLRDVDVRRARFLADVSHELRTPLTILRGETDVALRGGPDPSALREALLGVQTQARDLGALLDDLLAFARSDAEDQSLEIAVLRVRDLVTAATQEGEILAGPREILIEAEFADGDACIEADARRLKQALVIGLDNAVKHSPDGGRVSVSTSEVNGRLTISIADQGEGVAETDRPRVFDRFYRGEGGRRNAQGLGIGLSIAKDIVERHGGEIALDNRKDGGAVLTITLPTTGARPT
ncbi:sensor histidine kinase [Hansschlegelia zhihuaiae]|uniref:histidine kinase n=1 Tax=Hansschlegelia zhihuaiae TaxID=405005 RepID=A0A4V1KI95_9HYPH|nr:HAMP domain-containing sensor histidine kinase [Hansschlegelia zhihuaiae]RXF69912.1 sensor histidine kinase [Hansschlegelia zhihuaiae]